MLSFFNLFHKGLWGSNVIKMILGTKKLSLEICSLRKNGKSGKNSRWDLIDFWQWNWKCIIYPYDFKGIIPQTEEYNWRKNMI